MQHKCFCQPRMKLHENIKANRRISNIQPQNFEGWFRFAQAILLGFAESTKMAGK